MSLFTDDQNAAIFTRNCDLLVSAAAGSGKTSVLVERIIQMVLDPISPVSVDKLLVVTFTEAAAKEMKSRLEKALQKQQQQNPDNRYIQDQLLLLSKADITTIHSFCLSIIRKYFNQAGVDPLFRIADETEAEIIKTEVLRDLFEDLYNKENTDLFIKLFDKPENSAFLHLVEAFGDKIKDDSLQQLILRLYRFSQSHPFPELWLREQADSNFCESEEDIFKTKWYPTFISETKKILQLALNSVEDAISLSNACPYLPEKNLNVLLNERGYIKNAVKAADEGLSQLFSAMQFGFEAFAGGKSKKCKDGSYTDEEISAIRDTVKTKRENFIKKPLAKLMEKAFSRPYSSLLNDCNSSALLIHTLCMTVIEFSDRYTSEKRAQNIADFNDFEHLCLKVLLKPESKPDNIVLSDAAIELKQHYKEIMIDEYQDSNMVQEMILTSVSKRGGGQNNMFMVGDVKQSIYKFRLADPSIFMGKYNKYRNGGMDSKLITLSKNFRSRICVVDFVNRLFLNLMSGEFGEIEYDERAMLYYGAEYPPYDNAKDGETELIILDTKGTDTEEDDDENEYDGNTQDSGLSFLDDLSTAELEAKAAALRIRELINENFPVTEKDGNFRPAKYSDIVLLLRSPNASAATFIEEMKKLDIPAFSDVSGNYFDTIEIMTALSFLRIIDNPLQDIPLISVLHSPVYSFSADELTEIRLINKTSTFFDAMKYYITAYEKGILHDKISAFMSQLEHFRELASFSGVNELIWAVYTETDYFNYVGAMEGGAIRQANLTSLFVRSVEYERNSKKGLFHFIQYIEKLQANESELNSAKIISENSNAVRVMSIHKSKGLEFPIVIVCGLNKKFNLTDLNASVVMHQSMGIASISADTVSRTKSTTLSKYAISRQMLRESLSEELRVLYVAVTRAREKLILIGAKKSPENDSALLKHLPPPQHMPQYLLMQKSYLDWILAAVNQNNTPKEDFTIKILNKQQLSAAENEPRMKYHSLLTELRNIDSEKDYSGLKNDINMRLSYSYPYKLSEIPAKLSVSEIKRRYDKQFLDDSNSSQLQSIAQNTISFKKPAFMEYGNEEITPTELGTIMHTVLEHIPLTLTPNINIDIDSVLSFLNDLQAAGILSENEVKNVNKESILRFLNSEVYRMMKSAEIVKRESRFVIGVKPSEVNGDFEYAEDEILVHGIIDCMLISNDKITLIDYKTDYLGNNSPPEYAKRYETQIKLYKLAVEKMAGVPVEKAVLYFLTPGVIVEL